MPSHPIDFDINPDVFSTPQLRDIFEEKNIMQRWLDFESALAQAQGKLGIIPEKAADTISQNADISSIDLDTVRQGYKKSRNSVIPVLAALRKACGEAGQYVHHGATTQDVLDTALVIGIRKAISIIYDDLCEIEALCIKLAREHASTPMIGRTHGQYALPSTFGLKVSVWTGETRRNIERLKTAFYNMKYGQLGGAAGTMAALGPRAFDVAEETLRLLGLEHDPASWHTARDRMAETASALTISSMTLGKIANEIFQLQKTDTGELFEPPPDGAASSTMPHKQNPVICQRSVTLSMHIRALSTTVMESMCHEHERDPRSLWSEWLAMPQICIYSGTLSHYMKTVLSGLSVRAEKMYENLHRHSDMVVSEWLMFRLAETMGRTNAQAKVKELARKAVSTGSRLKDTVLADHETSAIFNAEDLAPLDRPELYTGQAEAIVSKVLDTVKRQRAKDPASLNHRGIST